MSEINKTYICNICGWVYDPEQGDPDGGIAPGTLWENIPDDWVCPVCGVGKEDFECVETAPDTSAISVETQTKSTSVPLVIVGSGIAGYTLARELRKRDSTMRIQVITADGGEVYSKPMLSNALARKHQPDDMVQKDAIALAKELGLTITTHTKVIAIDRKTHTLTMESNGAGSTQVYDRLVLALGADPRIFPVAGQESVNVFTVNDLDDYRRWRETIAVGDRILLIGAGLIGCEFANDLAASGFQVSMVDPAGWPLARLLPNEIGKMLVDALEQEGCRLYMGCTVAGYSKIESAYEAELSNAIKIPFDHVLSAVGLAPRIELAKQAGLDVQSGIVVDRLMKTSDPAIYALGDCVQTEAGPLPFIAPLIAQARALAGTLAGIETPLHLPALPVVVKTPSLPLVVCPPPAGVAGNWEIETGEGGAVAVFLTDAGLETGFALAGNKTGLQQQMASRMPDILPVIGKESGMSPENIAIKDSRPRYECDICSYVYDPEEGDPDGGIPPGTAWEDIPDDWVCPVCGAGKEDFTVIA